MKQMAAALLCVALLCACGGGSDKTLSRNGFMLDTVITVVLYGSRDEAALDEAFALCEYYDGVFSRTNPDSEVYRLNHAGGQPVEVSEDLEEVLAQALEYSRLTEGKYDVTICPVMDLWDFSGEGAAVPAQEDIDRGLRRVGWENIVISGGTVRLKNSAQIDLGSIAKGYIADKMARLLRDRGVDSAIINLGGNVVAVGGKPGGEPFYIGIQAPFEERDETIGTVAVQGLAVVSSGIYERSFRQEDQLYHHILDTATGYPAWTGLSGVTVVADSSAKADALSTALFLLGPEEGLDLAQTQEVEAVFITLEGERIFTPGFRQNLAYQEE